MKLKLQQDIDILEKFIKEACKKTGQGIYEIKKNTMVTLMLENDLDYKFFPEKFIFDTVDDENDGIIKRCTILQDDGKRLVFSELPSFYCYGNVAIFYSIHIDVGCFADCLEFDYLGKTYQIFRYYNY